MQNETRISIDARDLGSAPPRQEPAPAPAAHTVGLEDQGLHFDTDEVCMYEYSTGQLREASVTQVDRAADSCSRPTKLLNLYSVLAQARRDGIDETQEKRT